MIDLKNIDCMELMQKTADKFYDLAIVDPPYGIGMDVESVGYKGKNTYSKKTGIKKYQILIILITYLE